MNAELSQFQNLLKRFGDINEIASKETVAEISKPGTGIGKFGAYPQMGNNALNQDNIQIEID